MHVTADDIHAGTEATIGQTEELNGESGQKAQFCAHTAGL